MNDTNEAKRYDSSGRDVTDLPGLWTEEDTHEHLGSSDCSSGLNTVAWLRIMAALMCDDGKPHTVMMDAADRIEKLEASISSMRALLLGVLENDEFGDFYNSNLDPEFKQQIREAVAWKL